MNPIIIIGAGLAGWTTVREFRKLDDTTPVVMITADSGDFYAKPTLSNAFAQKKAPEQLVVTHAAKMAETQNVTLLVHTRVLRFDPYVKTVTFDKDGVVSSLDFSSLVLATGALPIRVPLAGDADAKVLSVNSLSDFKSFFEVLKSTSSRRIYCHTSYENSSNKDNENVISSAVKIVIMGAGLIGCEFANDLINAGYQVSVVDPASRPLGALLPEAASEQLRQALQDLGVLWHFGTTVQAVNQVISQAEKGAESALQVTLANGQTISADVVLSAIGLRADTRMALAAGLACERGIQVDGALQTSAPNVYALGDSAQYASAGNATLPYVMPIMNAARALAQTLASTSTGKRTDVVFPIMPVAVKTPALPLMIAPPAMGSAGQWTSSEPNVWQFNNALNVTIGFVLAGAQTSKRAEMVKLLQAAL